MPELPEVETVRRTLETKLLGLEFTGVQILLPKIIKTPDPDDFKEMIKEKKILKLDRRGKYLLINLSDDFTLMLHLRMTGKLVYSENGEPPSKHTHVIFHLSNNGRLYFIDMRQFGRIWLTPTASLNNLVGFKDLGVEPLSEQFTRDFLKKELSCRHAKIKPLLLNQTFIAGLGNIYSDEVLHRARINPERVATTLTPREIAHLFHAIQDVLREGIENRGTTVRDFIDGNGRPGNYQKLLNAYGREGKPCHHCGEKIVRKKVGGRSSYYCPSCQKE